VLFCVWWCLATSAICYCPGSPRGCLLAKPYLSAYHVHCARDRRKVDCQNAHKHWRLLSGRLVGLIGWLDVWLAAQRRRFLRATHAIRKTAAPLHARTHTHTQTHTHTHTNAHTHTRMHAHSCSYTNQPITHNNARSTQTANGQLPRNLGVTKLMCGCICAFTCACARASVGGLRACVRRACVRVCACCMGAWGMDVRQ
jgi:hypothetical protein